MTYFCVVNIFERKKRIKIKEKFDGEISAYNLRKTTQTVCNFAGVNI